MPTILTRLSFTHTSCRIFVSEESQHFSLPYTRQDNTNTILNSKLGRVYIIKINICKLNSGTKRCITWYVPPLKTTFNTQKKPYDNLILCQHKEIYISSYNFTKSGRPSLGEQHHISYILHQ